VRDNIAANRLLVAFPKHIYVTDYPMIWMGRTLIPVVRRKYSAQICIGRSRLA
jgi:hypothetical protein